MAKRTLPPADYLRQCLAYDPETGLLRWKERPVEHFAQQRDQTAWNRRNAGTTVQSVTAFGYIRVGIAVDHGKKHRWPAHRVIFKIVTGEDPKHDIDHINGVRSDNRWSNLREATMFQNNYNVSHRNKHGLKGVYKWSQNGITYYCSSINADGKRHRLGYFKTPQEAHHAYCEAAKRLHGIFANTAVKKPKNTTGRGNPPPPPPPPPPPEVPPPPPAGVVILPK